MSWAFIASKKEFWSNGSPVHFRSPADIDGVGSPEPWNVLKPKYRNCLRKILQKTLRCREYYKIPHKILRKKLRYLARDHYLSNMVKGDGWRLSHRLPNCPFKPTPKTTALKDWLQLYIWRWPPCFFLGKDPTNSRIQVPGTPVPSWSWSLGEALYGLLQVLYPQLISPTKTIFKSKLILIINSKGIRSYVNPTVKSLALVLELSKM